MPLKLWICQMPLKILDYDTNQLFVAAGGAGGKALQEPVNIFIFGSARTMASSQRGLMSFISFPLAALPQKGQNSGCQVVLLLELDRVEIFAQRGENTTCYLISTI